jgi:hypothetical protein
MPKGRIVVTGLIGALPLAGASMHWLQYVLGLHDLGYDVLYLEDTGAWYWDPASDSLVEDHTLAVQHVKNMMSQVGLEDKWTFINGKAEVFGCAGADLKDFLKTADLLLHVTGAMYLADEYVRIPRRAYVDTDPGFIQIRAARGSVQDVEHLKQHTAHFTFGVNVGTSASSVPTCGFEWIPTVQPLCMKLWPASALPPRDAPFTTIVKWQAYEPEEFNGDVYGLKDIEFEKFKTLPGLVGRPMELAMAGAPPQQDLAALGWRSRSGPKVSASLDRYRDYIRDSYGEWSVAKNAYVKLRTGWVGDRSPVFLASGRPVVLQSTGFENWLPSGKGIVPFKTLEEAVEAVRCVEQDYANHSASARELAHSVFDSRVVLEKLVAQATQ